MIPIAKPIIGDEEIRAVNGVLKSGMIAQGPKVKELEKDFAEFVGSRHAVAVNSGTAALHCSLYAAGIRPGDEVITTPFTFVATANAIMMQGAKPVFADIEEITFNIDPAKIAEKITKKTKAILPVDLYGHPYDYGEIKKIADENGLKIIEDACQAVGASYHGRKCGLLGDISSFSFYATKNLITAEGGIITTNDEKLAELARMFRHHGQSEKMRYEYHDMGYNYRMTDILAAIGVEQLKKLEDITKKRINNAEHLTKGLKDIDGITVPVVREKCRHVFHQYTIKVGDEYKLSKDELMQRLDGKGIGCVVYYPKPLHLFRHIKTFGYNEGDFPISEKLSKQVISLPVHPLVAKQELGMIINAIAEPE